MYIKFAFFLCKFCMSSDIAVNISFQRNCKTYKERMMNRKKKIYENERQILENKDSFWLYCCLSFSDLRLLITLLVSSNCS